MDLGNSLIRDQASQHLRLMYVWGHSYEFDRNDNWRRMEDFCALMAGKPDIWYAANGQIVDAAENFARLRIARDHSFVYNPSADPVWISVGNRAVKVPGGTRISLTGEKCQ